MRKMEINRDEAESLLWILNMLQPVSRLEINSIKRWAEKLEKYIERCDCKHKNTKSKRCYDGSVDTICEDCGERW